MNGSFGGKNSGFLFTEALYRIRSDCMAAIWFDKSPDGSGNIPAPASDWRIFWRMGKHFLISSDFSLSSHSDWWISCKNSKCLFFFAPHLQ